jgi:hypothetical protein
MASAPTPKKIVFDDIKTPRDWFYAIFNSVLGTILIGFPSYLFIKSKHFDWTTNTIIGICFFTLIILFEVYKVIIALELLFLPTKSLITIDKLNKHVYAKLSFFRRFSLSYERIKAIQLSGNDTIIKSRAGTVTYKRRVYSHQLQFLLNDEP